MAELWNVGAKVAEIANATGRTFGSVQGLAHRHPDLFRPRRFVWGDETTAALRRLMNLGLSYEAIGAKLGCTANAARVKAYKLGWTSYGRSVFLRTQRPDFRHSEVAKVAMSRITKQQWQDPEFRQRITAGIRIAARDPKRLAKIQATRDRQRGYSVRPDQMDAYRLFAAKLGSTREAARVLDLIPNKHATGGR